jgi:hypothetical protein
MRYLVIFAILASGPAALGCASVRLHGQSGSMCQPDTADYGLSQLDRVTEIVTATDSLNTRLRAAYNLQPVPEAAVSIVTDAAACAQAAQVMATKFNRPLYPVWLIRAGSNRYVVNDGVPVTSASSHTYLASLVLDQNFAVLETITYKR